MVTTYGAPRRSGENFRKNNRLYPAWFLRFTFVYQRLLSNSMRIVHHKRGFNYSLPPFVTGIPELRPAPEADSEREEGSQKREGIGTRIQDLDDETKWC
jgi:hypothetical protein